MTSLTQISKDAQKEIQNKKIKEGEKITKQIEEIIQSYIDKAKAGINDYDLYRCAKNGESKFDFDGYKTKICTFANMDEFDDKYDPIAAPAAGKCKKLLASPAGDKYSPPKKNGISIQELMVQLSSIPSDYIYNILCKLSTKKNVFTKDKKYTSQLIRGDKNDIEYYRVEQPYYIQINDEMQLHCLQNTNTYSHVENSHTFWISWSNQEKEKK